MPLKDCTFFVDVNGKQVEMDYDKFRQYLMQDAALNTLAPTLLNKKGGKAGFTTTAPSTTAPVKTETKAAEAKAPEPAPKPSPEPRLARLAGQPVTADTLRQIMNLTKAQAEAVLALWKAMGLELPKIGLAKGVEPPPPVPAGDTATVKMPTLRGLIEFVSPLDSQRLGGVLAIIRGFESANISTPIHEGAHFYRRFMLNEENGFTAQEIKTVEDWAGAKNGTWSVAAEEKWARGFEKYLRSGQSPVPELTKLFEKIARWMRKVYETVTGSAIDVTISPEVKRVFDRIFEIETERQKGATATGKEGDARTLKQEESTIGPVWRSNIASALKTWNQEKGTPQQLMAHLGKVKGAQEEAKWIGLNQFLEGKKSVSKAEIADFVDSNPYIVEEIVFNEASAPEMHLEFRFIGGENYREIVLTSPEIQRFKSHHYPDSTESYLAHMRVSTFTSEEGERVLLVDEAQSDLHQKGRKLGYMTPEDVAKVIAEENARAERKASLYENAREAMSKAREQAGVLAASLANKAITQNRLLEAATELAKQRPPRGEVQWQRRQQVDWISRQIQAGRVMRPRQRLVSQIRGAGLVKDFLQIIEGVQRYQDETQAYSRLSTEDEQLSGTPIIPQAPFRESTDWGVMLFKRAIRLAAEEGADFVAWTPGDVQKERYPVRGEKLVKYYSEILPKALAKFVRPWGGKLQSVDFKAAKAERGGDGALLTDGLLPYLQGELRQAQLEGDDDMVAELEAQIVEAEAESRARLLAIKEKMQLRTFPAVRVTPQMKAEAMKGFTLFQAEEQRGGATSADIRRKQAERVAAMRKQKPEAPSVLRQEESAIGPVWRSNIASALKTWNQEKGTPQQLMAHLGKVKGALEEAKWIGLNQFLEGKKSITKAEIADFVDSNPYVVDEVVLTGDDRIESHSGFRVAGGENYREIIFTSPKIQGFGGAHYSSVTESYLAHMRVADFETEDGESVSLVDEAQSDLHQKGRKYGYSTPAQIEEAKKKTEQRLRRYQGIREEVSQVDDLIDQASRYVADALNNPSIKFMDIQDAASRAYFKKPRPPLSPSMFEQSQSQRLKEVESLRPGPIKFSARKTEAAIVRAGLQSEFNRVVRAVTRRNSLVDTEQELAQQILRGDNPFYPVAPFQETADWAMMVMKRAIRMAAEAGKGFVAWTPGEMQGERFPQGGEKLAKFYNEILPRALAKFVRQWGGKLENIVIKQPSIKEDESLHPGRPLGPTAAERTFPAVRITPQMKAEAMKGFTLFQAEEKRDGATSADIRRKQAERVAAMRKQKPEASGVLKQEELEEVSPQTKKSLAAVDRFKQEVARKTGKPFSLLDLSPRDLDAYEGLIDGAERAADAEAVYGTIWTTSNYNKRIVIEKAALDWAGVSKVTPAAPPSRITQTPLGRFKTGKPVLVKVFHGTGPKGIQGGAFSPGFSGALTRAESARQGYFFAGTADTSEFYAEEASKPEGFSSFLSPTEEADFFAGLGFDEDEDEGIIHEFYVKFNNPLVYDMKGNFYRDVTYSDLMKQARQNGHDGVIITNTFDTGDADAPMDNIFTVLHGYENQIKSADLETYGPNGEPVPLSERFNSNTTSIYYQDDKPVTASVGSDVVRQKMKERAERLQQAGKKPPVMPKPDINAIMARMKADAEAEAKEADRRLREVDERISRPTAPPPSEAERAEVEKAAVKWAGVSGVTPTVSPEVTDYFNQLQKAMRSDKITGLTKELQSLRKKLFDRIDSIPGKDIVEALGTTFLIPEESRADEAYIEQAGRIDTKGIKLDLLNDNGYKQVNYFDALVKLGFKAAELERYNNMQLMFEPNDTLKVRDWKQVERLGLGRQPKTLTPAGQFQTGRPVLVKAYHGTGEAGIKGGAFSPAFSGELTQAESAKRGYFFAGTPFTSMAYAFQADRIRPKIYEFYVKLTNPLVYDMKGAAWRDTTYVDLMKQAKTEGHDGVIITNTEDGGQLDTVIAVLHGYENQIKSADVKTYGPDRKPVPMAKRFDPNTTSVFFQDGKPVTASVDSDVVKQKMKERAERLRQGKAGQAAPKAEAPPKEASRPRPAAAPRTKRAARPRTAGPKTDEQRLQDAKERAANPPPEPSEETVINRRVQGFINAFAKSLFAGGVPLTTTDADGNITDTESAFLDLLRDYRAAFTKADQGEVDAISAKLREMTRIPRPPKSLKQLMEEAKKRAGQTKEPKTPAQKREQDIAREVQKAINNFARLRASGKLSEKITLPDGKEYDREEILMAALEDLQAAHRTSNTYLGAPKIAEAQRRIMDVMFVPPRVPAKPYKTGDILSGQAWQKGSPRSPLSYLNQIGSYEAIAGELGAQVSDVFQFTRTRMAHGYYPSWGAAITDLQKNLRGLKEELRQAGFIGLPAVIDAHVERIRESVQGVGDLNAENVKKAWERGNIGGLASSALKAFVFNTSLRFSPKAILMNYLQPLFTLFPHVTPSEFKELWADSGRPETVKRVRDIALKESGGRLEGQGAGAPTFNPFTKSSERSRIMGHLAGEMMADRLNLKGLARDVYVRNWAEKVEFDNSAWNVPPLFSGNLKSVAFQFKPYLVKNIERFIADWQRGAEGASSGTAARRAKMIAVQVGIGGPASLLTILPGAKNIAGILILGYLAKALSAATGDDEWGEKIAEGIYYGAPAWFGLDLSSSVGFLEEPFGQDLYQQALNLLTGPAIYKSVTALYNLGKYMEDREKPAPLGREKEKEEILARRRKTITGALSPYSRIAETGYSLATGKTPDMFLDKPTPLTGSETILKLLGGSPIRQTKFYDYKEASDWQKKLLNRPIDVPGIKRLKGETDTTYKQRTGRIEEWRIKYGEELANHPRYKSLSEDDKERAMDMLQRSITEQANQVRPNEGNLRAARILRTLISGRPERARREKRKLYVEPED